MRIRPLSPKSTQTLLKEMQGDPRVRVVERVGNKVLVTSRTGNYCSWVALKNDKNWELILRN